VVHLEAIREKSESYGGLDSDLGGGFWIVNYTTTPIPESANTEMNENMSCKKGT
jgi:hypothetical protein